MNAEPIELPLSGSTLLSRQCSAEGAQAAGPRAGTQAWKLLELYHRYGPLTDHEAERLLGLPLATICARRDFLRGRRRKNGVVTVSGPVLVKEIDGVPGPYGTPNTRWGLNN